MMQDSVAESVNRAYTANQLPDIVHNIKVYSHQFWSIVANTLATSFSYALSGTSYENLIFVLQRTSDIMNQHAC